VEAKNLKTHSGSDPEKKLKGPAKNQQFFEVFEIPRTVIKINGFSNTQHGPFFGKSKNHPKTRFGAGIWFSNIRLFPVFLLLQNQRTMMPVPSKPQKTDGFHLRTDKDPEVTSLSHIYRTVVMRPKIRLITSGSVPVSATRVLKNSRTAFLVICTIISFFLHDRFNPDWFSFSYPCQVCGRCGLCATRR
jgi:hypothetical protein